MDGLPDRTGDPKDSEFGRQTGGSASSNGPTPAKSPGPVNNETPFVEFVSCFLCGFPLSKAEKEGRNFWLTSCDHVLCSRHDHEKGRCTLCGKTEIAAYIINKELPIEMRTFLQAGGQLLDNVEHGVAMAVRSAKALKYQGDQLMRTARHLQKQLVVAQDKAATSMAILEERKNEKAEWQKEKAALESQIAELRNIIAVNDKGLSAFVQHPTAGVMPVIPEEGDEGELMNGHLLGKRSREDSSPAARKSVDRITLAPRQGGSSSASHSSPRSGPRHMEQIRTNLGQFRYNPTPEPQTSMTPYRPHSAAPPGAMIPRSGSVIPQYNHMMTPAPNNVVARLRQNGRSERDDSPSPHTKSLGPSTAMAPPMTPGYATPMNRAFAGPPDTQMQMQPPPSPAYYGNANGKGNSDGHGQQKAFLATPRHHALSRF